MKKNLIPSIIIVSIFILLTNSCRQETETQKTTTTVNLTAKNLTTKEYQKKLPFKTDTTLIKIIQKTFLSNTDLSYFETKYGKLYWDYAISLENKEHHSVIIPILKENNVVSTMHAILKDNKIFFIERKDKKLISFLEKLIFYNITSFKESGNLAGENSRIIAINCKTMTFTVGCPPGYGDCQDISYSMTSCDYINDGTGFPGSGNPDQMEICHPEICGDGGGGFDPEFESLLTPPPPKNPIADIKKFLSCLNINQSATLTVYA
ncbi:hypothetical protein [Chryseobacterium salivictor]|uniref:Uncharacterized protein n=1 Tax=Chryseobacterium salivictor TaxID=2547600 RepID=A0A4P6ZDW8_9FLAO|nr:hypothetical protein [Chryseobacterium salivictor]QBO57780.1 hypothetical protein NBC122_00948 [Chryseobacterium salivictor]